MKFRHLLAIAGAAAYFAAGSLWLGGRAGRSESVFTAGSIYEGSDRGASLGFEYLRERGRKVAPLLEAIDPARVPADAVVFRLSPLALRETIGRDEVKVPRVLVTPQEEEWLSRGGRLVLGVDKGYETLAVESSPEGRRPTKVFPVWPGVSAIHPPTPRRLSRGLPASAVTLLAAGPEVVAASWRAGRGELVVLTCPEVFENAHIATGDHLRWLEALAGAGRPVLFDEAAHGSIHAPGLMALMLEWRLGPALVLAAVALMLAVWRSRARLGPPEDQHEETRTEAVDLVDSLALLYRRALGRAQLLCLYHDALRRRAAVRTGLKGPALDARLADLTGGLPPPGPQETFSHAEFDRRLQALNRAFDRMEDHAHTR